MGSSSVLRKPRTNGQKLLKTRFACKPLPAVDLKLDLGVYDIRACLVGVLLIRESYYLGVYVLGYPYVRKPPFDRPATG